MMPFIGQDHGSQGIKDSYQPALTHLTRNVRIIISTKVIDNLLLQAWRMLTTIATMHLLTHIHCKDCSIKHRIQLPYLIQKKQDHVSFLYWISEEQRKENRKLKEP